MAGEPGNNAVCNTESHETLPVYGEKGFCAIRKSGKTQRMESRNISDLRAFMEEAEIAWIDYVVDDVEHDGCNAALAFGFSDILIRRNDNIFRKNTVEYRGLVWLAGFFRGSRFFRQVAHRPDI